MNINWVLLGGGSFFGWWWVVVGGGGYILGGGGFSLTQLGTMNNLIRIYINFFKYFFEIKQSKQGMVIYCFFFN